MKHSNIFIAIIEDDADVRKGLERYFLSQPEFEKILAVPSVEAFFESPTDFSKIDVVLTDIGLPGKSGIEGIKLIKEKNPQTDVIMITVFKDSDKIFKSLCSGATGYILKGTSFEEIKESILTILKGGSYMSPTIARKIVEYFNPLQKLTESKLTQREEQIVKTLVDGLSYKLIADRLSISVDTVRFHIKNIYTKLEVNSKSEVIAKFLKNPDLF
ncbi:DNA-binding response regulator [Sphingobacteriaceae bacterium]|nr:DNA-binding response regulator [Sphingobacteriaceae bacterium]